MRSPSLHSEGHGLDPSRREHEIEEAEAALAKRDHDLCDANKPDYRAPVGRSIPFGVSSRSIDSV
jgi:hypothetical protein